MEQIFTYDQAYNASLDYFGGDELAAKVWLDKYALRTNKGDILEDVPSKTHRRLAREFARIEAKKFKIPLIEDEIYALLDGFKRIIPQGSPMFGIGNNHQTISLSNCFLLDVPLDSYSSIMQIDEQLVNISKRRGGVGIDLSNLRPAGSMTHNAAKTSTGIVTWMERYSNSIREVGQSGRRGALMLTLSIHHPDILAFCTVKNDPAKVTGANISVRLTRAFLDAVKNGEDYEVCFPVDYRERGVPPMVTKRISAKQVWETIIHSAWLRAEPGLLMWDNVVEQTPADCYPHFRSRGTNPCCFSTDSTVWIITKAGYKEIKTVTKDDLVWSGSLESGFKKTSGYFKVGIFPAFRVTFDDGLSLDITDNHKLQRNGRLVELNALKVGDGVDINQIDPLTGLFHSSDGYDMGFKTIESIESIGLKEVGCIEVEDVHRFAANGIVSGNSEINLSPLDSCRLLLLNLLSYVIVPFTPQARFDFELFRADAKLAQRLMDDLVDLESEKIDAIIAKVQSDPEPDDVKAREIALWKRVKANNDEGRRTGTGITALGDALAALGIPYGSDQAITITEDIYRTLKLGCYESSVEMAEELGAFVGYSAEAEKDCPFIQRIAEEEPALYARMVKSGRRNVSLTTTAPAGSVSLLTRTTSGIEPLFMTGYTRRKKINPNDKAARVDFVDPTGDSWQEFTVYHPQVQTWMNITGETDVAKAPWTGNCAEDINWVNRVKLQAAAQKHVCHAISSTINLPENVAEEQVSTIYQTAFQSGLKGITVYRKNCRSGVMVETSKSIQEVRGDTIVKTKAPKRPLSLIGEMHHFTISGHRYYVAVGLLNGDPYEILAGINHDTEGDPIIPRSVTIGSVIKQARSKYIFKTDKDEHLLASPNSDGTIDAITRMVSTALRHGADISFVVHQLEKTRGEMKSFAKTLARTLKKYIKDGTEVSGDKCESCGGSHLIRENGCKICKDCGSSVCG